MGNPDGKSSSKMVKSDDVALICGRSEDGAGLNIVRKRDDKVEFGTVQPLKHGKAISGEVVRLIPRKETPLLCDVEVQWSSQGTKSADSAVKRPAQVATDSYRKNWDSIWQRRRSREALN